MVLREIHLRVYRDNSTSITSAGWRSIGWPGRVEIVWDDERGIGVREGDAEKRTDTKLPLPRFLRTIAITVPRKVRIAGYADGGTLWFDPRLLDARAGDAT